MSDKSDYARILVVEIDTDERREMKIIALTSKYLKLGAEPG